MSRLFRMALPRFASACFISIALVSCRPSSRHDPVLAQAFVGPATVTIRKEITFKSPTVATLHFGDKIDIITTRRRFVKVRTRAGVEGWINDNLLLGQRDMDQIQAQSAAARKYPSQGVGTTFETMNVHAQPNRTSPSYLQVKEGEKFDVLEHRLVTVSPAEVRKSLIPTSQFIRKPKKESKSKVPPPPAPAAPALPLDWQDLSKEGADAVPDKSDDPPPATPEEDWSLVRTSSGQSGWVLSRRIYMSIPDEVAQYAEGHRITSYFKLGKVQDGDRVKDIWLWTTIHSGSQTYDYDGFRVFIWSLRHHRYETAFIQRRLEGYFPTIANAAEGTFSVCIAKDDGQRYRREYRLVEKQVKFAGEKPCEAPQQAKDSNAPAKSQQPEGMLDKIKGKLKSIIK